MNLDDNYCQKGLKYRRFQKCVFFYFLFAHLLHRFLYALIPFQNLIMLLKFLFVKGWTSTSIQAGHQIHRQARKGCFTLFSQIFLRFVCRRCWRVIFPYEYNLVYLNVMQYFFFTLLKTKS